MKPLATPARARLVSAAITAGLSALASRRAGQPACTVRVSAPGVPSADVPLQPGAANPTVLRLHFLGQRALVHTLLTGATRPVLPIAWPWAYRALPALSALGSELTWLTAPDGGLAADGEQRELAVTLLLRHILPAGLLALADAGEANALARGGTFSFAMGVYGHDAASWLAHFPEPDVVQQGSWHSRDGCWVAGSGWPNWRPSASLAFANVALASRALAQRLDELAAVCASEIVVSGRVPLTDTVGQLLNVAGHALRAR